jgi:hypothetical protein
MEDLKAQLLAMMSQNAPFDELYDLVKAFKLSGGSQEEAYQILKEMRPLGDEAFEDRILDLLDIVVGFCHPDFKIWDTYLKT